MDNRRICLVCGTKFSAKRGFCPVCILRKSLAGRAKPSRRLRGTANQPISRDAPARLAHYELVTDGNGRPVELGRGAMGVTYKALDVDLHCLVTLKVINEKCLGDEATRLRFLREARAGASLRHPNVASVIHLGRTGKDYFYAMEFVEGQTLEKLIKCSGRLEIKTALEIAAQVSAGLASVHKQRLVHRDIKPSNIMVNFDETGAVAAKIIDLGLAKAVSDPDSPSSISTIGGFAGTPEFASPEQFAGVGVDIRSDLYSLGVTLWEMVSGHGLFKGPPAEVMYQHQHAPVPVEELEGVPQPVIALIQVLLEKDPKRRFQTANELLKAIPAIRDAVAEGRTISPQSLRQNQAGGTRAVNRKLPASPEKISLSRLPVTGSEIFGREEDFSFLNAAWANRNVNVVTVVAWAGVGKSALVNHWLRGMAAENFRAAELVFGWSFYRQGSSSGTASADEFLDAALTWFGDSDPRIGNEWEKGERLAELVARRRTLLVLDGLEPLQHPPGPQEGRLREPSLQAFLRELAIVNPGLCVITSRIPVADIADCEHTSAPRRDLERLSSEAGAKLLRALGVSGDEADLRSACEEFSGHSLALTLLGSYLTDAYNGDIRCRTEVSRRLSHDVRRGVHAREVMNSYQVWFGEGPEVSVLRLLGLFDRLVDERALQEVLRPPVIRGLTETLNRLSPVEWRTIVAKLRRASLLGQEDPNNPRHLDAHPLVREYFGEQLRNERPKAWKESNKRLYHYYRALAPARPETFREMEPLFLAAICGCNAGLFHEVLHDVYIRRIQRGEAFFAANILGARGALLSVLAHFFGQAGWGSPLEEGSAEQKLEAEDQLYILMQAGLYLTATRGFAAPEVRACYERAEPLCHSLDRPRSLYVALLGQWRHSLNTAKLTATLLIAERARSLARQQNDPALMVGAYHISAVTLYFLGNFESARREAMLGVEIWPSGGIHSPVEDVEAPAVTCRCLEALLDWHAGEFASCHAAIAEATSLARELNTNYAIVMALWYAAVLAHFEKKPAGLDRLACDLVELSTRQNFPYWRALGAIFRGWARNAGGDRGGISLIEEGIRDYRATGSMLAMPYYLALKAEALQIANRDLEALRAISEAMAIAERTEERWWLADLHRLQGQCLAAAGAGETEIEEAFREAIDTAERQKSISLAKRAESTYAEYCSQRGRS
jgi:serine/threonine protein kinase/predicted ATPase